jgi:hypothetical protein
MKKYKRMCNCFRKSLHDWEKVLPRRIVMLHTAECFVHDEARTVHRCVKHIPPCHEQDIQLPPCHEQDMQPTCENSGRLAILRKIVRGFWCDTRARTTCQDVSYVFLNIVSPPVNSMGRTHKTLHPRQLLLYDWKSAFADVIHCAGKDIFLSQCAHLCHHGICNERHVFVWPRCVEGTANVYESIRCL